LFQIKHLQSTTGWVEFFNTPIYNKDGSKMAIIASQTQNAAGDYRHLTVVSTSDGITEALTSGRHIVTEIITWDDETELIFYLANTEADSHVSHVYAKRTDVPSSVPICVTCDIVVNGVKQTYFSAEIKPGTMVLTSLGPSVPHTELYSWTWNNNEVKLASIMEWEGNADINEALHDKHGPNVLFHDVQLTPDFAAKVLMQVPHNADLSGAVKYPMLIDVYAGPDSVAVTDKWAMDWGSYMATNQSVVYVRIDGRGSGLRGDRILHAIYRKLGTLEVEDQISTAL
jgi:dipeptidyl-peptidase 4